MYGENHYDGDCIVKESGKGITFFNCGGEHEETSLELPNRVIEMEVAKIREVQFESYVEAVNILERSEGPMFVNTSRSTQQHTQRPEYHQ